MNTSKQQDSQLTSKIVNCTQLLINILITSDDIRHWLAAESRKAHPVTNNFYLSAMNHYKSMFPEEYIIFIVASGKLGSIHKARDNLTTVPKLQSKPQSDFQNMELSQQPQMYGINSQKDDYDGFNTFIHRMKLQYVIMANQVSNIHLMSITVLR